MKSVRNAYEMPHMYEMSDMTVKITLYEFVSAGEESVVLSELK